MKRHEACYWINEIANDARRSIDYLQKEIEKAATDESKQGSVDYYRDRIAEAAKRLEALDIAGDALTK